MLYPQNGDRTVTIDYVTSLHPVYISNKYYIEPIFFILDKRY